MRPPIGRSYYQWVGSEQRRPRSGAADPEQEDRRDHGDAVPKDQTRPVGAAGGGDEGNCMDTGRGSCFFGSPRFLRNSFFAERQPAPRRQLRIDEDEFGTDDLHEWFFGRERRNLFSTRRLLNCEPADGRSHVDVHGEWFEAVRDHICG